MSNYSHLSHKGCSSGVVPDCITMHMHMHYNIHRCCIAWHAGHTFHPNHGSPSGNPAFPVWAPAVVPEDTDAFCTTPHRAFVTLVALRCCGLWMAVSSKGVN